MWPAIMYVHVCMYLILYPSPYAKDDMLNYKSLDSFQNFQNGCLREVLVKEVNRKEILIAKVSHCEKCVLSSHKVQYINLGKSFTENE